MDSDESRHVDAFIGKLTRRQVLQGAAAVGGAFALGPVIAACGGGSSSSTSDVGGGGGPKKGGSLKVALTNGSVKDTLDPHIPSSEADTAYNFAMFDGLCQYDNDYRIVNALAEEITPNADDTEWMVRLKPDVVFHDGKPLTADDVVYSFERILDPKDPKGAADQLLNLSPGGTTKVDNKTVKFTLDAPNAVLLDAFGSFRTRIVPVNFDPKKPIGTGPFKLKSYRPGEQAVFGPNTDFWGEGPYVDELTLLIVVDNTARVNSLLGGSVEMIAGLPRAQAGTVEAASAYKVLRSETGAWDPFTMRIDQKPFDDVRVRQAFRLIVDRKQMIELAYAGYGSLGNDMCGRYDLGYPKDLPQREQDLEKAKFLLKEAGYEGLSIELVTSDGIGADVVAAAQVFAEQAKGAGVKVNIKKVDSGVFYGQDYLTYTFAQDYWNTRNYLMQAALGEFPRAPLNETHWKNDKWLAIVQEAFRTVDETKRNKLVSDALTIEYDEGASILWAFRDLLDGYSGKLGGVKPDKSGSALGSYRFNVVYFK